MAVKKSKSISSHIASVVNLPGYKIKDLLGRGGMAVVYLAVQESIGREVALKVLTPDHSDESFTDRFLREAQIISRLTHPNIVTVFDAGVHQGCHYMSMEYIPGLNLRQARDTLTRKQKINIIKQVAMALDYAGKKGFVHRDIKPENILQHEDGRAILTDFGIARGMESQKSLTITGKAIGTPYYMSPEQTKGLKVDPRSDIYSLGIVLFQVLAGYLPYDGASLVAIGIKHISDPVPELPAGLAAYQDIVNKAMAKNPDERYQTAGELVKALDAIPEAIIDEIDKKSAVLQQNANAEVDAQAAQNKIAGRPPAKPLGDKTQLVDSGSHPSSASPVVEATQIAQAAVSANPLAEHTESFAADPTMAPIDITTTDDYKKLRHRRRLLFFFLLSCAIAAAYINQKPLLQFWQTQIEPSLQPLIANVFPNQEPTPIPTKEPTTTPATQQAATATTALDELVSTDKPVNTSDDNTPATADISETEPGTSQISELLASLDSTPENAKVLVQLYQDALDINPDDASALEGIAASKRWFQQQIQSQQQSAELEQSQALLDLMLEVHPAIKEDEAYQTLLSQQQQASRIQTHLKMARVYINTNALLKPEKANALAELQAARKLAPQNPQALALSEELTNIFIQRAKQQQGEGKLTAALQLVKSGLLVNAEHPTLISMQENLEQRLARIKQIRQLLAKAQKQFAAGNLLPPNKNNAYDLYNSVLSKQKNNSTAKTGLRNIQQNMVNSVQIDIKDQNFENAQSTLNKADNYFKNSPLLSSARAELDAAIDASLPKVSRILFSDKVITSLDSQQTTIQPSRTLHIGFEYKNFANETTLIQANLLDGSGQVQIAQKPVILNTANGTHYFYMELPVEGFADGTYNLELILNKKSLIKKSFQVQRKISE